MASKYIILFNQGVKKAELRDIYCTEPAEHNVTGIRINDGSCFI